MHSRTPKVLHRLAGRPMLEYVILAARNAGIERLIAVVPQGNDAFHDFSSDTVALVEQDTQLGPADALARAQEASATPYVLVLNGDIPLLRPETLERLLEHHSETGAVATLLTAGSREAGNAIAYCFDSSWLWPHLAERSKREDESLLETLGIGVYGEAVAMLPIEDPSEAIDVNDRVQMAEVEQALRQRICRRLMLSGVTIVDPATTYIDDTVALGEDTVISPNTHVLGHTQIGADCRIGPNSYVEDSIVGKRCRITASTVERSTLEADVDIGPYSHLRPGAVIGPGVHIGNYVEVKNARLGSDTKVGHFSYLGDAVIGANVNIGAGTITCNFDGVGKHQTIIEDGVFVGSDTMLIAPVSLGKGAKTGAGAVVTHDVPAGSVVVGVPARALEKHVTEEESSHRS